MTNRTQGLMVGIAYQSVRQNIWGCRPPFLSLIITQIILKGCNSASCLCKMTWAGCLTSKLPDSDLQVSIVVRDTLHPGPSGCHATRTIRSRDRNGSLAIVSVDTTTSDNVPTVEFQQAPPKPPK
jgi:hypothetical protein